MTGSGSGSEELLALQALRDSARALLALEADPELPDEAITPTREAAAALYAEYVARFGPLNRGELRAGKPDPQTGLPAPTWRRPDLGGFRRDPEYLTVIALEDYDPSTLTARPAPILTRRVHGRNRPVEQVANVHEALAAALGEGHLDLARVAALAGLPDAAAAQDALGELIFADPERGGAWVTAREYLSGDVRAKHETAASAARGDPRYRRNVDALAAATPPDLGPLDIAVSLGAPWVSPEDVEAFVHEVLGGRVKVWHLPSAASWKIVPLGRLPANAYATPRMSAYALLSAGLNGRAPVVSDPRFRNGKRVHVRNVEQSLAAQDRLTALQERFRTWIWEDAGRTARLCAEYNRRFNTHVVRGYDGSQLTFPGLADGIDLWPWQRDIVARIISSPATLCGHAVGAGKTRSMVCAALTARRLGLARKPLIAVPAHLLEQVAREARQAYPFGRFLIAGEELFAGGQQHTSRDLLAARCATGDWDAVIMSHGTFTALPVAADTEAAWQERRLADLEDQRTAGRGGRHGRSVLTRRIRALEAHLDRLRASDPPSITFDALGVDLLLVDEAHYFKRLPVVSRMEGISLGSSRRAADLLLKAQVLRARRGARPSLALFTGTPWSNTVAETFVWQTFVQPDALTAAGVDNFDAWAAVFVDYDTLVEVTPDSSGIRLKQRPSRIRNLPELRRMLAGSADVLPADALGLERPDRVDDTVVCRPTPGQRAYVGSLGARVDKIRREQVRSEPGGDNMLVVCGDGRRAALDPALVGVPEASTKIAALADRVARIHHAHADLRFAGSDEPGVFQLVFCDQGTPGPYGLQTYGRIRVALAERGVPAERVRWVHEARTDRARAELFAGCRDGRVSVLIGSTDTLGVGTNVQTRLRAVHHADAPWRPSDIEQREGRAFRPGNLNPVVDVVRYVTRSTFDAYMWQTLERKAGFVEQLYRSDPGTRSIDDLGDTVLTFAEVKALATGNPLLLEHAHLAAEVARLRVLRAVDTQTLSAARQRLAEAQADRHRHVAHESMLLAARTRLDEGAAPANRAAAAADLDDPRSPVRRAAETLCRRLTEPVGRDDAHDPAPHDPAPHDPAPVRAPWGGLGVELIPAGGWRTVGAEVVSLRITLAHRRVDEIPLPLTLVRRSAAAATRSVTTQLRAWLTGLDQRIGEAGQAAADAHEIALDADRVITEHRFERADELAAAQARLADLTTALEASVGHGDSTGAA